VPFSLELELETRPHIPIRNPRNLLQNLPHFSPLCVFVAWVVFVSYVNIQVSSYFAFKFFGVVVVSIVVLLYCLCPNCVWGALECGLVSGPRGNECAKNILWAILCKLNLVFRLGPVLFPFWHYLLSLIWWPFVQVCWPNIFESSICLWMN